MGGELAACLVVLFKLLVVDGPDLGKFGAIVRVLNGGLTPASRASTAAAAGGCSRCSGCCAGTPALFRA